MKRNGILIVLVAALMVAAGDVFAQVNGKSVPSGTVMVAESGKKYMDLLWQAGEVAPAESVELIGGADSCFVVVEIPDGVWSKMQGKSYQENPYIGREDLRLVRALHHDGHGEVRMGEMVCNKQIARMVAQILRQLYVAGYGIERMVLPDVYDADDERQMEANNTSCFCYRKVAGSKKLSKHAMGLAVDVNPLYNPHCKVGKTGQLIVHPSAGRQWSDRTREFQYKIDRNDLCYKLFTQYGFSWGGAWRNSKDYQHFELDEH